MTPPDCPAGIESVELCPACGMDRVRTRIVRTGPGATVTTLFHVQCGCGSREESVAPDQT